MRLRTISQVAVAVFCNAGRSRARSRQNRATAPMSPIQVSSRRFASIRRRSVSSLKVTSVGWINRHVMAPFSLLARITSVQSRSACWTVSAVRKFRMRSSPRESSRATGTTTMLLCSLPSDRLRKPKYGKLVSTYCAETLESKK